MQQLSHWLSYLFSIPVQKYISVLNGPLQVRIESGRKVLNASQANYSFASLHLVFQKAFQELPLTTHPPKSTLLLGMGAGSVIDIMRNEYQLNSEITAVEYDPMIVEIARDHFGISNFKNLNIITADAFDFVKQSSTKFDLVVLDIFNDHIMPSETLSIPFIESLIQTTLDMGHLVINYIIKTEVQSRQLNKISKLLSTNGELKTFQANTNWVLIWQKM